MDRAGNGERLFDMLRRPFAEADITRFARAHDLAERAHRFLQRCVLVIAVALIEVDMIGLEAGQRGVDLLQDLLARKTPIVLAHRGEYLRREHIGVAGSSRERFAQKRLRGALAIGIRRIDEIDAEFKGAVDAGERIFVRRKATITRAGLPERLWTRLAGNFELTELYDVSFTERRRL